MQWMDEVTKWMAIHPVRVDLLVLALVSGTIVYILNRQRRRRRVWHRRMWAMHLKRKDLERLHLMRFEDAITDAAYEMVARGEMSEAQEKVWYNFFAEQYGMKGVRPPPRTPATVKRGIQLRMQMWWAKIHPKLPGGKPGDGLVVDKTYDPTPVKFKSKYVQE